VRFGWLRGRQTWAVLIVSAALLASASAANAGTYTTWYCRDGAGRGIGLRDWSRALVGVGYTTSSFVNCPDGAPGSFGPEVGADSGNDPDYVSDGFTITAPASVRLDALRLLWEGGAGPTGRVKATSMIGDEDVALLTAYTNTRFGTLPQLGGQEVTLPLAGAQGVGLRAECLSACQDGGPVYAWYEVYRAALLISDLAPPQGRASGNLLVDPVLRGVESVAVDAHDVGAGVYLARVLVDGQVRASAPFADAPCQDVDPTNSDPFEFSTTKPCPDAASAAVPLDTEELGEDTYHHVQVDLLDASGNSTLLADRVVGVDNRPSPAGFFDPATRRFLNPAFDIGSMRRLNGVPATADARFAVSLPVGGHARARRTVTFGSRPTIRGLLTARAGKPIAGATIWMASRFEDGEWRISGRPRTTSATGRVGFRLPPGLPSRDVNLVYFPYTDSHDATLGRPVALGVRAGMNLRTTKSTVRNGQRVTFVGRVAGHIPARGATIGLQAKVGPRYRTFRQVRVTQGARGRFVTRYRFKSTTSTTRYRFRAIALKQSGLPYETGKSSTVTVLVRA
jgi:hypothetical protein